MDGALEERRYSSYSLTSAPGGGEWSASRPGSTLLPRKKGREGGRDKGIKKRTSKQNEKLAYFKRQDVPI
jgi:hypothetical protein